MADIGFGTVLSRVTNVVSTDVYTAVANVFDISGPEIERDDVDLTVYDSADRYREYIPGLREGGEITATLNLVSTAATLQSLYHSSEAGSTAGPAGSTGADDGSYESNTASTWRMRGPSFNTWRFAGYVKGIVQAQPIDDRRTWEVTWKITGRPIMGHTTGVDET